MDKIPTVSVHNSGIKHRLSQFRRPAIGPHLCLPNWQEGLRRILKCSAWPPAARAYSARMKPPGTRSGHGQPQATAARHHVGHGLAVPVGRASACAGRSRRSTAHQARTRRSTDHRRPRPLFLGSLRISAFQPCYRPFHPLAEASGPATLALNAARALRNLAAMLLPGLHRRLCCHRAAPPRPIPFMDAIALPHWRSCHRCGLGVGSHFLPDVRF